MSIALIQVPMADGFEPTTEDVEALARHYESQRLEAEYLRLEAAYRRNCFNVWAPARLYAIREFLGTEAYERAIAGVTFEWEQRFSVARRELANLVECTECGGEFVREYLEDEACTPCADRLRNTEAAADAPAA